jgi:hypothetical protein
LSKFCLCIAKDFGIRQQKQLKLTVFCSAAQRKFWNLPTKATQIDSRAAKFFEFANKQLTQIDCTLFSRAAKFFEFANKSNST